MDNPIAGDAPPRGPRPGDSTIATLLGGMAGAVIGLLAAFSSMIRLPVPSGPNAMAEVFIAESIQTLAILTFIGGGIFGVFGSLLRPSRLAIPLSIIMALLAAAFCGSTDPLIGRMAPFLLSGLAIAVLAGAGIQSWIEK